MDERDPIYFAAKYISKRDLQAAVRDGTYYRGYPRPKTGKLKWKLWFSNIAYVTTDDCLTEITSYVDPLPLESVQISNRMQHQYNEAKRRNATNPALTTSHSARSG